MRLDELIEDEFMDNEINRNELIEVCNLSEIIEDELIDIDEEVKEFDLYISEWIENDKREITKKSKTLKNNLILGIVTLTLPGLILGTLPAGLILGTSPTGLMLGSKLALGTSILSKGILSKGVLSTGILSTGVLSFNI